MFTCFFTVAYRFIKFSPTNDDEDENSTYTLTFNIEFPHENDTVYFAHSYPYTYSDLQVIIEKNSILSMSARVSERMA